MSRDKKTDTHTELRESEIPYNEVQNEGVSLNVHHLKSRGTHTFGGRPIFQETQHLASPGLKFHFRNFTIPREFTLEMGSPRKPALNSEKNAQFPEIFFWTFPNAGVNRTNLP